MQIQNLEQLLRRPPADTDRLGEVEELNRRALHSLHEASVVDGGSNSVEDLLAELLLTGEERSDADFRGSYPASDFVLELLPLEALHVADAELLDSEFAEAGVDGGFSDAAVHLDALAQVAGGDHALGDATEVVDGVGGDEIDLADAAGGAVAAAGDGGSSAVAVETEERGLAHVVAFVVIRVFGRRGGRRRVKGLRGFVFGGGVKRVGVRDEDVPELVF